MNGQTNLFTGQELRDKGIKKAVDHAGVKWADEAYEFLLHKILYMKLLPEYGRTFMVEDVRRAAIDVINDPPSNRAWGGVIRRAANAGLIEKVGIRQVTNPKAHCANANVWRVI